MVERMTSRRRDKDKSRDRRSLAITEANDGFDQLGIVQVRYIETDLDAPSGKEEDDEDGDRDLERRGHHASTIAYAKRLRAIYQVQGAIRVDYSLLFDDQGEIDAQEWIAALFDGNQVPNSLVADFSDRARGVVPQAMVMKKLLVEEVEDDLFRVGAEVEVTAVSRMGH